MIDASYVFLISRHSRRTLGNNMPSVSLTCQALFSEINMAKMACLHVCTVIVVFPPGVISKGTSVNITVKSTG